MDCNQSRQKAKDSIQTCTKQLRMSRAINFPKGLSCARLAAVIGLETACCGPRVWSFQVDRENK